MGDAGGAEEGVSSSLRVLLLRTDPSKGSGGCLSVTY